MRHLAHINTWNNLPHRDKGAACCDALTWSSTGFGRVGFGQRIPNWTPNCDAGFPCQHREYEKAQDTAGISWWRAHCLKCHCCYIRTSLNEVDFICHVSGCQQVLCDADSVDPDTQQSALLLWDLSFQWTQKRTSRLDTKYKSNGSPDIKYFKNVTPVLITYCWHKVTNKILSFQMQLTQLWRTTSRICSRWELL